MSFHEKSSWIMAVVLSLFGIMYFETVFRLSFEAQQVIAPMLPLLIKFMVGVIVFSVVGHIVIATVAPNDAQQQTDEREKTIFIKAANIARYVLAFGAISGMIQFMLDANGNLLFFIVFGSVLVAEISEYVCKIIYYRTAF